MGVARTRAPRALYLHGFMHNPPLLCAENIHTSLLWLHDAGAVPARDAPSTCSTPRAGPHHRVLRQVRDQQSTYTKRTRSSRIGACCTYTSFCTSVGAWGSPYASVGVCLVALGRGRCLPVEATRPMGTVASFLCSATARGPHIRCIHTRNNQKPVGAHK